MPMPSDQPTQTDLQKLPLRAIVAYAVRCARRVQPLYGRATDVAEWPKHAAAVEEAISLAERFCRGEEIHTAYGVAYGARDAASALDAKDAARAAAAAARAAGYAVDLPKCAVYDRATYSSRIASEADDAARAASRAAGHAADGAAVVKAAARADFERLLTVNQERYPELGSPLDAAESGPLGPLWLDGPPDWFISRQPVNATA